MFGRATIRLGIGPHSSSIIIAGAGSHLDTTGTIQEKAVGRPGLCRCESL